LDPWRKKDIGQSAIREVYTGSGTEAASECEGPLNFPAGMALAAAKET